MAAGGGGGNGGGGGTTPVDHTPPAAPTIAPSNGTTISGTAEPGSKVGLDLDHNGSFEATVDVGASGNWTYTPATPIADGTTVTGQATDAAGNTSGPTTVVIDARTPVPTIASVSDDVGVVIGEIARGGATDDKRPTLAGAGAEANATITIFDGAIQLGTTTADASGKWSFTPTSDLAEGGHNFTVQATDGLGNKSPSSAPYAITVDTTAPAAPILAPSDGTQLTGTAEPGTHVNLDLDGDGETDATVPVDASGHWTHTPATPIPDGMIVTGHAQDNAGNTSGPGSTTIDSNGPPVDPEAPVIQAVTDDVGTVVGTVAAGGVTDDTRPRISGTGAGANATVTIFDGATAIGTTTADATGNWAFTPGTGLGDGVHDFTATSGTSEPSAAYGVRIDATPPAPPVIDPTDGSPVTGTAEPGSTVRLDIDGNGTFEVTVPTNGAGSWTYTPSTPIPDGTTVTAHAVDEAGNVSGPATTVVDLNGDGQLPAAPTITSIIDNIGIVTGQVSSGGVSDDTQPTITGTGAAANATVSVYDGSLLLGTTTANTSGGWSFTPTTPLAQGSHNFSATVTSGAGTSAPSNVFALTLDTTPPAPPVINPTDGSAVTGTAEPNGTVRLDIDGNGTFDVTVPTGNTGNWNYTPPVAIPDGTTITARAVDAAGNVSGPANEQVHGSTPDTTPPPAPVITGVTDDVAPATGNIPDGGTSNDPLPMIVGTAEIGSTVTIYNGSAVLGIAVTGPGGQWTFTPPSQLADATYTFSARATDGSGNTGASSNIYDITIATGGNTPATIGGATSGTGPEDTPAITGTLTATDPDGLADGTFFTVTAAAANGTATIDPASGAWSYAPNANFNGSDAFTVTVTDDLGGTTTQVVSVTVTPQDDPAVIGGATSGTGPEDTPAITGTLTATDPDGLADGTYFTVTAAAANGTATIDPASGAWSYAPNANFNGTDAFTVTVTDDLGGTTTQVVSVTVTPLDTLVAVNDAATLETGSLQSTVGAVQTDSDTQTLGLVESTYNVDNSASVTIPGDYPGELRITVSQTALLAVADAFRLDVYDAGGTLVYSANTPNSLVGDVAGLPVLGVVNDDTLVATITGLAPGDYTIVVRNDQSTLGGLLDTDGTGISLSELDGSGLLLGAGNEAIILDAVEAALNGSLLGLPLNIGTVVRGLLDPLLDPLYGLPLSEIVSVVSGLLDNELINLPGVLDEVVDAVADNLLSNTLTLLQTTTITTQFTEYDFANETVTGNVITGGSGGVGADDLTGSGGEVTLVSSTNGNSSAIVSGGNTTIVGVYGELTIASGGAYTYTAYGAPASTGQTDVFTYTLSDGTLSDTATLTIDVVDTSPPVAAASITAISEDTAPTGDWATNDVSPTISGTLSAPLNANERVQVQIDGGGWQDATANGGTWFFGPGVLALGDHTVVARTIDSSGNTTAANNATQVVSITNTNAAPVAIAAGGGLLGLIGADVLGLIEIGNQAFVAYDPNNNLSQVVVSYNPLLSIGEQVLAYSTSLAAELGLAVDVGFNGIPGVTTLLSTLTITRAGGGSIDNLAINELLKTVHFDQNLLGLPAGTAASLLSATSISVTDGTLTDDDTTPTALDLALLGNLFNASGDPAVIEGTGGDDPLTGTTADEHLYGYAGADTLLGGGGNDLLRGGAGIDTLDGGTGNDLLIYDSADASINGGAGFDAVLVESGGTFSLANLQNIEQVRIASDQAVTATLTADSVMGATDANHELIISGGGGVSLSLQDASYEGQVLIGDLAYEKYTMGLTTVYIEDPILITVF